MLEADLHVHSLFSHCGLHTFLELLTQAKTLGLKAIAITDHGLGIPGGRLTSVFFERFTSPYPDVTLYKGVELNVLDEIGIIDTPWFAMPFIDIVLLGIHPNLTPKLSKEYYTEKLLAAMIANPYVDIITHPNDPHYPLDFDAVAQTAASFGMALELNNSKVMLNRSTPDDALRLITACKNAGCRMALNSDTHVLQELGVDYIDESEVLTTLIRCKVQMRSSSSRAVAFLPHRGFRLF